jgi:hypothetical protein
MAETLPSPKSDSKAAAASINTGIPDKIEATAIELAAREYAQNGVLTNAMSHFSGKPIEDVHAKIAAGQVRDYLNAQGITDFLLNHNADGRTRDTLGLDEAVTKLVQVGQTIAQKRGQTR